MISYNYFKNYLFAMPLNLPNGTIKFTQTFDRCGNLFKAIENAMAGLKEESGNGSIQGSYALKNNGKDKSWYYFEL